MVNMNAQQIIKILKRIKKNRQESYRKYSDERYFSEMPYYNEIFTLAEKIEPYNEGENRAFFFWTDRGSYDEYVDNFKENFIEMTEDDYINNRPGTVNTKEIKEKYQSMFPEEKVCFYVKLITPADEKTHGFNRVDGSPQILISEHIFGIIYVCKKVLSLGHIPIRNNKT